MNNKNIESSEVFKLHLTGGQMWNIISERKTHGLVHQLAKIMRLEPSELSENAIPLIFTDSLEKSTWPDGTEELAFCDSHMGLWIEPNYKRILAEVFQPCNPKKLPWIMRRSVQIIQHLNVLQGGLPLHAALAELDGTGVLLAARAGTGKSTCSRRLPEYWNVLGDDETLVVKTEAGFVAHPFPTWSSLYEERERLSWNTEFAVPIKAVFFLEQAQVDELVNMPQHQSCLRTYASVYPAYRWFRDGFAGVELRQHNTMLFHNACNIVQHVKAFTLRVSLKGVFWQNIERIIEA
jgi:SynChlorMet cassette protein ScmC